MIGAAFMGLLLAFRALARNRLRASLTITGLLVGVAAVIVVSGLSNGARDFVSARLKSMGTNILFVTAKKDAVLGRGRMWPLSEEDVRAIAREAPAVTDAAPILSGDVVVSYADRQIPTQIAGTTSSFFTIRDWKIARGEVWTATEELTKAKVCVLGATLASQLFGDEDAVGKTVRIGKHLYRVSGVLVAKGRDLGGTFDQDQRVILPIGSARQRLVSYPVGTVSLIIVSAASPQVADRAQMQVEGILRQRHKLRGSETDFKVLSQSNLLQIQQTVLTALTAFLLCVASMSLLVGGIGIMNIMLVSVTERTREIGIRLAVGASRADVLFQFLVEAAVLSGIGGVLGIVVGLVGLAGFEAALNWPMTVTPLAVLIAVAVSAMTGIIFGFAPAHRASRLDPIEALRHE